MTETLAIYLLMHACAGQAPAVVKERIDLLQSVQWEDTEKAFRENRARTREEKQHHAALSEMFHVCIGDSMRNTLDRMKGAIGRAAGRE